MGQAQSNLYDTYYSALENKTEGEIELNPYVVLNISENFTWDELVKAYRKVAIKVHPDKGGSPILFDAVSKCFRELAEQLKTREIEKPHDVLKNEFDFYKESQKKQEFPSFFNTETFNKTFETNKMDDEDDNRGYSHFMEKSRKDREDFKIPKLISKFSEKQFNETFEKVVPVGKEIIIYKDPQPVNASKNLQFTELGGKTEEFTTDNYTDYYKAHTTSRLVDPRSISKRKEYKTISDYEEDRKIKTETVLSEAELKYQKELQIYNIRKETERVERLHARDEKAEKHYEKMNQLLIGIR